MHERLEVLSALHAEWGERALTNELLARHTTLRIGGPADLFIRADTRAELEEFVRRVHALKMGVLVIGNGSNVLVADDGVRGVVIDNHAGSSTTQTQGDSLTLTADSGALLSTLGNRLAREGWSGLEWAIGVPTTVGAAIAGNAGAQGKEIRDNLIRAEILSLTTGPGLPNTNASVSKRWWSNAELGFEYRNSLLKARPGSYVVLQAEFNLSRDLPENCVARMNEYTDHRRGTQPTEPSVGSMFKNPPGDFAGRLIDAAGMKGERIGQIQVSSLHANFFINRGGGTAAQVMELVEKVRAAVLKKFGIRLDLEIQLVGDW